MPPHLYGNPFGRCSAGDCRKEDQDISLTQLKLSEFTKQDSSAALVLLFIVRGASGARNNVIAIRRPATSERTCVHLNPFLEDVLRPQQAEKKLSRRPKRRRMHTPCVTSSHLASLPDAALLSGKRVQSCVRFNVHGVDGRARVLLYSWRATRRATRHVRSDLLHQNAFGQDARSATADRGPVHQLPYTWLTSALAGTCLLVPSPLASLRSCFCSLESADQLV